MHGISSNKIFTSKKTINRKILYSSMKEKSGILVFDSIFDLKKMGKDSLEDLSLS